MTRLLIAFCTICCFTAPSAAQIRTLYGDHIDTTNVGFSCGWHGEQMLFLKDFRSNEEAKQVMQDIMDIVGIPPNFEVQAAKVPNAAAVVYNNQQYIFYNPQFIQQVTESTNTDWASISILAHEIGHHLSGHTLKEGGSQPTMELEADEFSGFVLRKMGASLQEAQVAMRKLASPFGSRTHPGRDQRLTAIERGWNKADRQINKYAKRDRMVNTKPTTPTPSEPSNPTTTTTAPPRAETVANKEEKKVVHPKYAAYQVKINSNPNSIYYITRSNKFIAIRSGSTSQLGVLDYNNDPDFPYKINFDNPKLPNLLINRKAQIFSEKRKLIGSVSRVDHEKRLLSYMDQFDPVIE